MANIQNKIEYGNGEVFIDIGESVIGFDMLLAGTYELESYDITNFVMKYNNHRVIGVGLGSRLGNQAFLKYTGDLKILKCIAIKDNLEKVYLQTVGKTNSFSKTFNNFDGENANFEDLNFNGIVDTLPTKIKTTFLNNKIYDKDGKKIDVDKITDGNITGVLQAINTIKTPCTRGGGY